MLAPVAPVPCQFARTVAHVPGGHVKYGVSTSVSLVKWDYGL
jgi:hypothetical protein